jgi:hypothetical protein
MYNIPNTVTFIKPKKFLEGIILWYGSESTAIIIDKFLMIINQRMIGNEPVL